MAASAQNKGGSFHLSVGYQTVDVAKVNAWVQGAKPNYPAVSNGFVSLGVGGYGVLGSVLLGGDINGGLGSSVTNPAAAVEAYTVNFKLTLGLLLAQKRGFVLYPFVSPGYGAFAYRISEANKQYPAFVPAEQARRENVVLINQNLVADVGLGAELFLGNNTDTQSKGFKLGIRAGYTIAPAGDSWAASRASISDASRPSFGPGGPFIRLLIGAGKITRR